MRILTIVTQCVMTDPTAGAPMNEEISEAFSVSVSELVGYEVQNAFPGLQGLGVKSIVHEVILSAHATSDSGSG